MRDYFEGALAVTFMFTSLVCFGAIGLHSLSENDPRKKYGSPLKWKDEDFPKIDGPFDWEEAKLEFMHILNGVKIGGKYVFVPKPGTPKLEDYLREKEARLQAERNKESGSK